MFIQGTGHTLGIEKGFKKKPETDILISRVVEITLFRIIHRTDLFAFSATGTNLNVGELLYEHFLVWKIGLGKIKYQSVP
jgi:hypothetical protein